MATSLNYNVGVSTNQAVQALNSLQAKLGQTNKAFEGLKGAIAGVITASAIAGLYKMANELTDMAAATGVSTEAILGFSKAVSGNGGTMEGATMGVAKFVQAIESAAGGSKEAQDTFLKLGISLNDLRMLTEEDLLKKAVAGFDRATTASERMALAVSLFGKVARSWDMSKINEQLAEYIDKSKASAASVAIAGEASQNFSNAYKELGIQILVALKPISELANAILSSGSAMKEFIRLAIEIATVAVTFTVLGKIWKYAAVTFAAMGEAAGLVGAAVAGSTGALTSFSSILMVILRRFPLFAAIGVGVSLAFGQVRTALEELGIVQKKDTDARNENSNAASRQTEQQREVVDALQKEKEALNQILEAYKRNNSEANKKFRLETESLALGEKEKLLREQLLSAEETYNSQRIKLLDDIKAKQASSSESEKAMVPQIKASLEQLTAEYTKQQESIRALSEERVRATEAKQFELFSTKELIDSQNKLKSIQDDMAKSTLSTLEKKYYDIDAIAKSSAKSAIEAEEARRNAKMPLDEQRKYYTEAAKGNEQLKAAAEAEYKNSRTFSTGWTQAFNEYVENATNAGQQAQRIFQTMTQGMEDLLVGFFKTGKLGWREFVQNIVEVMLRSQIQQLVAKTFGGVGSIGGGGGGSGGLFGGAIIPGFLASGGPAGAGKPYIVGERGPELFVPGSSGTVIPNNSLGGGSVTYNINAVDAMSFKQMIARDPAFIHAVASQGAKTIPGRY